MVKGYTFVEHYAGCGVMTDTIRDIKTGFGPAVKLDIEYSKGMDILTPGGFACMTQTASGFRFHIACTPNMVYPVFS